MPISLEPWRQSGPRSQSAVRLWQNGDMSIESKEGVGLAKEMFARWQTNERLRRLEEPTPRFFES